MNRPELAVVLDRIQRAAEAPLQTPQHPVFGPVAERRFFDAIEHHIGYTRDDLLRYDRSRELTRVRKLAMGALAGLGLSLSDVGRIFDRREHSTVLAAVRSLDRSDDVDRDRFYQWACEACRGE